MHMQWQSGRDLYPGTMSRTRTGPSSELISNFLPSHCLFCFPTSTRWNTTILLSYFLHFVQFISSKPLSHLRLPWRNWESRKMLPRRRLRLRMLLTSLRSVVTSRTSHLDIIAPPNLLAALLVSFSWQTVYILDLFFRFVSNLPWLSPFRNRTLMFWALGKYTLRHWRRYWSAKPIPAKIEIMLILQSLSRTRSELSSCFHSFHAHCRSGLDFGRQTRWYFWASILLNWWPNSGIHWSSHLRNGQEYSYCDRWHGSGWPRRCCTIDLHICSCGIGGQQGSSQSQRLFIH